MRAAFKFKAKARDGIAHLVKIGRCTDAPDSIAKAFYDLRDVLDKTAMGEFMGGEKELNIKVHALHWAVPTRLTCHRARAW